MEHKHVLVGLETFRSLLEGLLDREGDSHLSRVDDYLFLNDARLTVDFRSYQAFQHVLGVLKDRGFAEIAFSPGVELEELAALVGYLNPKPTSGLVGKAPEAELPEPSLPHLGLFRRRQRLSLNLDADDGRLFTLTAHFRAISVMDRVFQAARNGEPIPFKRLKHVVQTIVDLALKGKHLLLALVNVKDCGQPGSSHAVNVAILSVALGARLGLERKALVDLGLAALLHDLGKVDLPENLSRACLAELSPEETGLFQGHVTKGFERLLKENMTSSLFRTLNVVYSHHCRYDRTGYPKLEAGREQDLYARIVAVADYYDNATTPRRLEKDPRDPHQVLRALLDRSGTEFDAAMVKTFLSMTGLYPVGCLVRLDTGEVGTVVAPPSHPLLLDRPTVKILADAAGQVGVQTADLMERDAEGRFRRTILMLFQQQELRLELEEYLSVV